MAGCVQEQEASTASLRDVGRRNRQLLEEQTAANEALEVMPHPPTSASASGAVVSSADRASVSEM